MEYRNLGSAGVKVSTLCLGAMTFGEADANSMMHQISCNEPTSHAILNRALEAGINFIDTADIYGQDGLSERVIGNWFERDKRRDEVVIATKFRFTMGQGPNRRGASRYRIMKCVEDSLRRLKTDRIDLYQIHMQDLDTPEEETLRALDDLVRQGKVLYIGASNYAAYRLVDSLWHSRSGNLERFVTLQARYNLISREMDREHIPLCRKFGLGILPWSPLAGGFLTGKYHKDAAPGDDSRLGKRDQLYKRLDKPNNWAILDAVLEVAEETGATAAQIALAWVIQRPCVTSVIFGARSLDQLNDNLKAAELSLSEDQIERLDKASAMALDYPYNFMSAVQGNW